MFRGESRWLKMSMLTLSAVIIAVSTNNEPNEDLGVVADAGPIDEPLLREGDYGGIFGWIFDKHTIPHCWIILSS